MSSLLYPLSLIERLSLERHNAVLADEFDAGNTSARAKWPAQYFKRRFQITHAPLTLAEFRYLRSFHAQRSGEYDSFVFRDNVHRGGNALVRFNARLAQEYQGRGYRVGVELLEIAALRSLPEFDELTTAAGSAPLAWYDANREVYYTHAGAITTEPAAYDTMLTHPAAWQGGTALPLGNPTGQYQHYAFTGTQWAAASAAAALSGAQPACTVFAIARHGTISSRQILFSVGAMGTGKAVGIGVSAANYYEPFLGGSETWSGASYSNSSANVWRSLAYVWAGSSNTVTEYVNVSTTSTASNTRNFTAGPLALGAALDGTLKASGDVAHALVFAAELTANQVKAVHNLLGYQFGLATVA